jgi:hypothetical protein
MFEGDPNRWSDPVGPFRADQIHDGDRYELSNGHAIHCMTTGGRHSHATLAGGRALGSDPAVSAVGADTGIAFNGDKNLRAPDLVVNVDLSAHGWIREAPPLAVEYVSVGQDMRELARKIAELLEFGVRVIWVVYLVGPLRVEVHERGAAGPHGARRRSAHGARHPAEPGASAGAGRRGGVPRDGAAQHADARGIRQHRRDPAEGTRGGDWRSGGRRGREAEREQQLALIREQLHAQIRGPRVDAVADARGAVWRGCADSSVLLRWLDAAFVAGRPSRSRSADRVTGSGAPQAIHWV